MRKAKSLISSDNKQGEKPIQYIHILSLALRKSQWMTTQRKEELGRGQNQDDEEGNALLGSVLIWTDVQIMTGGVDVKKHFLSLEMGNTKMHEVGMNTVDVRNRGSPLEHRKDGGRDNREVWKAVRTRWVMWGLKVFGFYPKFNGRTLEVFKKRNNLSVKNFS